MACNDLEREVKAVHDRLVVASSDPNHNWHNAVKLAKTEYGVDILARRVHLNQFRGFVELFDRLAFEYNLSESRREHRKEDAMLLAKYRCGVIGLDALKAHSLEFDWFWGKVLYKIEETIAAQINFVNENPEKVQALLSTPPPNFDTFVNACKDKKHLNFVKCLFPFVRNYALTVDISAQRKNQKAKLEANIDAVESNLINGLAKRHVAPDASYLAYQKDADADFALIKSLCEQEDYLLDEERQKVIDSLKTSNGKLIYASIQQMLDVILIGVKAEFDEYFAKIQENETARKSAEKQLDAALMAASLDAEFYKDDVAREKSVRKEQERILSGREADKNKAYAAAQETIAKLRAEYSSLECRTKDLAAQVGSLRSVCATNKVYIAELEKERKVLKERAEYLREHAEEEHVKLVSKVSELEQKLEEAKKQYGAANKELSDKDGKLKTVATFAKQVCEAVIESAPLERQNEVRADIVGYLQRKNISYDDIESCVYNAISASGYLHTNDMEYIIRGIGRTVEANPLRADLLEVLPIVIEAYAKPRWFARLNANFSQGVWKWLRGMWVCPSDISLVKHVQNFVCGYNDVAKGKQQAEALKARIESQKNMNDYVLFTS